jgi:hypothetical protein
MLKTVEGFYRDGQIQLSELLQDISNTQVLVTFLDPDKIDPVKLRQLIEQLETIAGIQQGFEEVNNGQTRPIGNFIQEIENKYDIIQELLEDLEDLQELRAVKKEERDSPSVSLDEVK